MIPNPHLWPRPFPWTPVKNKSSPPEGSNLECPKPTSWSAFHPHQPATSVLFPISVHGKSIWHGVYCFPSSPTFGPPFFQNKLPFYSKYMQKHLLVHSPQQLRCKPRLSSTTRIIVIAYKLLISPLSLFQDTEITASCLDLKEVRGKERERKQFFWRSLSAPHIWDLLCRVSAPSLPHDTAICTP